MSTYIHKLSDVQAVEIGFGTKIWQYCVILPRAKIGSNCNICAQVFIENDVVIGNEVTIKSGVQLWDGVRIEDKVFIGPNVTFTNDKKPRSKLHHPSFLKTLVCSGASLGANSTILPGVIIGARAMVGAGSVVTKNIPPYAIVTGNPARIVGYADTTLDSVSRTFSHENFGGVLNLGVGGCALYTLPLASDMRGNLSVAEYEKHIPFIPKRCFWVFNVPSQEVRGEHAHKTLHQYLICIKGSVSVLLDDLKDRREVLLNQPNFAIYIPPRIWGVQYKYSEDAVLLVLASEVYDPDDYLRSYDEFRAFILDELDEK